MIPTTGFVSLDLILSTVIVDLKLTIPSKIASYIFFPTSGKDQ